MCLARKTRHKEVLSSGTEGRQLFCFEFKSALKGLKSLYACVGHMTALHPPLPPPPPPPPLLFQVVMLKFEDVSLEASQQAPDIKTAKRCVAQVQELVFQELSRAISERLISSVNYLRESVVGTLQRCLERLEDSLLGEWCVACGCGQIGGG